MDEQEEFKKIFAHYLRKHGLTTARPWNDGWVEIYKDKRFLGRMNPEGFSLLYNLQELAAIIKNLEV